MIVPVADNRMPVESGADQLAEFGPGLQRRQPHVRGDKAFAVVSHEREQLGFLLLVERHFAVAHEEDGVDIVQIGPAARWFAGGL